MRKRRSDSPWSKLTPKQRRLMDEWYFEDGLSQNEIIEQAASEFGIEASQQTLTSYFRYREKARELEGPSKFGRPEAVLLNRSRGMAMEDLEARAICFSTVAAYEMSQAEPDKMRVKELRSLMKMLSDRRRALAKHNAEQTKFEFQQFVALARLNQTASKSKGQTREEVERVFFAASDIWQRTKQRMAEQRAEFEASQKPGEEASSAKPETQSQTEAAEETCGQAQNVGQNEVQGEHQAPNMPLKEDAAGSEVYKAINKAI